jgi:hypothetical protein
MMDIDDEPMDTQTSELLDSQVESGTQTQVLVFPESLIGVPKPYKVGELLSLLKVIKNK